MKVCDYGCGKPAIKFLKSGKGCCSVSVNSCFAMKKRNGAGVSTKRRELGNKYWSNGHPKGSAGGTSLKGKTYEEIYGNTEATNRKNNLSNKLRGNKVWESLSQEVKDRHAKKISAIATKRHAEGWDNKAGRCKKYKYFSPVAGDITVDGTWELAVAQWLDLKQYNWKRNKIRFAYTHLKGHTSHYTPDFWVKELGGYLEVKGYETKLDKCKWRQFTENLVVWKKQDLKALGIL